MLREHLKFPLIRCFYCEPDFHGNGPSAPICHPRTNLHALPNPVGSIVSLNSSELNASLKSRPYPFQQIEPALWVQSFHGSIEQKKETLASPKPVLNRRGREIMHQHRWITHNLAEPVARFEERKQLGSRLLIDIVIRHFLVWLNESRI